MSPFFMVPMLALSDWLVGSGLVREAMGMAGIIEGWVFVSYLVTESKLRSF